ncbi:MAG TPA: EamA family transporter [Casimicrobiaceae bacterium]|nr:EamA family transporter [Casimicrobiaceae bacterium]
MLCRVRSRIDVVMRGVLALGGAAGMRRGSMCRMLPEAACVFAGRRDRRHRRGPGLERQDREQKESEEAQGGQAAHGATSLAWRNPARGRSRLRAPCLRAQPSSIMGASELAQRESSDGMMIRRGVVHALLSAALFGVSTPLAKALLGEVPPLELAGLLYLASGAGLLLLMLGRAIADPSAIATMLPQREDWGWLGAAILLGGVLGPVALLAGLAAIPASTASLLLNLESVFTALLAWFLFRENFDRRIALGMVAIVIGGLLLVWSPGQAAGPPAGAILVAAACLCWALDNNLTRRVSGSDAVAIAALKGLVAGAVNLGLALSLGLSLPPVTMLAATAAVGLLGYGLSLVLFVLALRDLGAARTGAYFSVAPFFGAVLALALAGEPPTLALMLAGALMAAGVWLHVSERHLHEHVHELQEHAHAHRHDEHHRHAHDFAWDGREPHTHPHVHAPLVHAHPHYPDLHHRHPH